MNKPQVIPSRDAVTALQVSTVLNIIQVIGPFLERAVVDPANPHVPGGAIDGGARMAAEATLIKACSRLDAVLEDKERWSMQIQNVMELQIVKMLSEQISFYQAQTLASRTLVLPHIQHHPSLARSEGGTWVAFIGPINKPTVFGIGATPELAMIDFDASFRGEVTESQLKYLAENPDTNMGPKTKKKK